MTEPIEDDRRPTTHEPVGVSSPRNNMTRRKIKIEKLDTKRKIMVTYAKRRETVFKKADELCALPRLPDDSPTRVAVITFSINGRPFVFGSPDVDSVVDAFLHQLDDVDDEQLSSLPLPAAAGSRSCDVAAHCTTAASFGSSKGKRKKEEEEEEEEEEDWLSLEGCDTLEALEAKRDEFVKAKAMIDELKLIKARTGELPSTSAAQPPIVSTAAAAAADEVQEQQYLSDLVAAAGGAESSDKFVIRDDDVYVSLDAFFP